MRADSGDADAPLLSRPVSSALGSRFLSPKPSNAKHARQGEPVEPAQPKTAEKMEDEALVNFCGLLFKRVL